MALRIAGRELAHFFSSPIAYLFLAAYLAVTLFVFFWGEAFFARNISDVRPMFEWLPVLLIFLAAALTMRMWSDERRTGTLELVVTVPATSIEFVVGKFLACWGLLVVALALTVPLPVTVSLIGALDWGPVFAGYVAAAMLGAAYISIGLFVSAKTENQIVALILAAFGCGVFYLVGAPFVTELFGSRIGDVLRQLGAGSRFDSITRGVLDLRDLYFYASVLAVFLALNVYAVDSQGWAADGNRRRHGDRRIVLGLVAANFLLANLWLSGIGFLRWDVTEGNQYSISDATKSYLRELQEPLLIRGYFSSKTHPLLAPLGPQLKDLLREYGQAGGRRVRVELIDPAENPELEDEANTKYGIRSVAFQVADRHQASLVNSYFDVLVQYGDEYEVLGFGDLIEVKVLSEDDLDVRLKNPEYEITRSIKKVLFGFQGGGSVFDSIAEPVMFIGYISPDQLLPEALQKLRADLDAVLLELAEESEGKLSTEIVDPLAGTGELAERIAADFGFRPLAASLFDTNTFYFHLTLTNGSTLVQMPIPETLDREGLRRGIEEGLKRFAAGLLKTVALAVPPGLPPYLQQQMPHGQQGGGNEYNGLREVLDADFDVDSADLSSGDPIAGEVLMVVEPSSLGDKEVFAIDQFLMRGGTVVIASGSFRTTMTPQSLTAVPESSGLVDWLEHHGISLDQTFVLDPRCVAFPVPFVREAGGFRFQEVRMRDYPYFVDVRDDGLNQDVAFTSAMPQVTVAWASPIDVDEEKNTDRQVTTLLSSSPLSWRSSSRDIMPDLSVSGDLIYTPEGERGVNALAVMVEGRFESFFETSPLLEDDADETLAGEDAAAATDDAAEAIEEETDAEDADTLGTVAGVIDRSPESARLVLIGSASFLADSTLRMVGSAEGMVYTGSSDLMANLVDWAVEDRSLLSIRARGHFNRTLDPMEPDRQRVWEYANYVVALVGLGVVFGIARQRRVARQRAFRAKLEASS